MAALKHGSRISRPTRWIDTFLPFALASAVRRSCATVSIPPVPHAPSQQVQVEFLILSETREDHVAHQLHHIARRPVFARLLIEATNQLLENRPHAVVVETGMTRTVFASSFHTGFGERVMSDEANLENACPAAAASAGHAARSLPHTTENSARTETTRQLGFIRKPIKKTRTSPS